MPQPSLVTISQSLWQCMTHLLPMWGDLHPDSIDYHHNMLMVILNFAEQQHTMKKHNLPNKLMLSHHLHVTFIIPAFSSV